MYSNGGLVLIIRVAAATVLVTTGIAVVAFAVLKVILLTLVAANVALLIAKLLKVAHVLKEAIMNEGLYTTVLGLPVIPDFEPLNLLDLLSLVGFRILFSPLCLRCSSAASSTDAEVIHNVAATDAVTGVERCGTIDANR